MQLYVIKTFGSYIQNGDRKEPIEWLILETDGKTALLISKYPIDCGLDGVPYNEENTSVTWEECTLRKWLNEDFYNTAFSKEEQSRIITSTVTTAENPEYDTNPGNDTQDKIFLLSIAETEMYFESDGARICANTWWWLRSPGADQNHAALVCDDGSVNYYGYYVNDDYYGCVRPALWIKL